MIVQSTFTKEHVGIQRKDLSYLFLHWKSMNRFRTTGGDKIIDGGRVVVAPTSFVEWVE